MNFLITIDNNFAPQAAACIASICSNNRQADSIQFFILSLGVEQEAKAKLQSVVSKFQRQITFMPIGSMKEYFGSEVDTLGWNEIILARLLLDRFLPKSIERVIYLDADTIAIRPLNELWDTELGDCIIGAVREPTASVERRRRLSLTDMKYFNSGVLLIDLNMWREEAIEQKLLNFCVQNRELLFASDQDAINGALSGRIYELSPAYNYCNSFHYYPYETLNRIVSPATYIPKADYADAICHPAIIHFLGEERPWRAGSTHEYREQYATYLRMTPFAGAPQEEGWTTYFKAWTLFNLFTRPFPMMRYRIIESLIPAFMKYRKKMRSERDESEK